MTKLFGKWNISLNRTNRPSTGTGEGGGDVQPANNDAPTPTRHPRTGATPRIFRNILPGNFSFRFGTDRRDRTNPAVGVDTTAQPHTVVTHAPTPTTLPTFTSTPLTASVFTDFDAAAFITNLGSSSTSAPAPKKTIDFSVLKPKEGAIPEPGDVISIKVVPKLSSMLGMNKIRGFLEQTLKDLSAAADENNPQKVADLGKELKKTAGYYSFEHIAPILERAMENNRSLQVRKALTDLPGVEPAQLLLDLAARDEDIELVKHLLRKGAKPGAPDSGGSPEMQRLLEAARNVYKVYSNPFQELTQAKMRKALEQYENDEESYAQYLRENSVTRMTEKLQAIVAATTAKGKGSDQQLVQLANILANAPPAVQREVMANFVLALGESANYGDAYLQLVPHVDQILILLEQRLAPSGQAPQAEAIQRVLLGMLDGIANTPQLSSGLLRKLMRCVAVWCTDPEKVGDDRITGMLAEIRRAIEVLPEDVRRDYEYVECIAFVRSIASTLDQLRDEELPGVVRKMRRCAKHCLDKDFHDVFVNTIDRIDQRQPSIGEIPKVAHAVWVGKPISEENLKNIAMFMYHNRDYEVVIGTDSPKETQRAIEAMTAKLDPDSPLLHSVLLDKLKVCHIDDWLPADNEIGDLKTSEIRNLLALEGRGPGKKYSGVSNVARLLALRSEKSVNGERKRGGLYFDVDLQWHRPLPPLSSPLGITTNVRSGRVSNNLIGVPADTEILDRILIDTVHGYRERRRLDTVIDDLEFEFPELAAKIQEDRDFFTPGPAVLPTNHDDRYQRDPNLTDVEKLAIYAQKKTRALRMMENVHPGQYMMDYARHRYQFEDVEQSPRFGLGTALSGSYRLWNSVVDMLGEKWTADERMSRLGSVGRESTRPSIPNQVYTEPTDKATHLKWINVPLARRASVGGTTPDREKEWE